MRLSVITLCLVSAMVSAKAAEVSETFATAPWRPSTDPNSYGQPTDGVFKIDGPTCVGYPGAYPNVMDPANATFTKVPGGSTLLTLTVLPGRHHTTACSGGIAYSGAEVSTIAGWRPVNGPPPFGRSTYGYGYYATSMKPSCAKGEVSSFFWVQAPNYGPLEIDVEFPDPPGHLFNNVHWTIHPSGQTINYRLGFNPCATYHSYGFIWTPGQVEFTVDGSIKYIMIDPTLTSSATGFIMANAWTGDPAWGGGPPTEPAPNKYRGFWYWPNVRGLPLPK